MSASKPGVLRTIKDGVKSIVTDKGFWGAGAVTGLAYTAGMGARQLQKVQDSRTQATSYKKMLEVNPALAKKDGAKTLAYFNSMYRVAPNLAQDPYVSGAWVHNVIDNEDPHDPRPNYTLLAAVQDLASPGKNVFEMSRQRYLNPNDTREVLTGVYKDYEKGKQELLKATNTFKEGYEKGRMKGRKEGEHVAYEKMKPFRPK